MLPLPTFAVLLVLKWPSLMSGYYECLDTSYRMLYGAVDFWILIKNKLQILSVIHEINLSLTNISLVNIYCSTTLLNHRLIRLKKLSHKISLNLYI